MRVSFLEIERINWDSYGCGCGLPAGHLAQDLRDLISATTELQVRKVDLTGHIEYGTMVFEVAPVAVTVMMAALSENLLREARHKIHLAIFRSLCGEEEVVVDGIPVAPCASAARAGLWQLYKDAVDGFPAAPRIINLIDEERSRLEYFVGQLENPPNWVKHWGWKNS